MRRNLSPNVGHSYLHSLICKYSFCIKPQLIVDIRGLSYSDKIYLCAVKHNDIIAQVNRLVFMRFHGLALKSQ